MCSALSYGRARVLQVVWADLPAPPPTHHQNKITMTTVVSNRCADTPFCMPPSLCSLQPYRISSLQQEVANIKLEHVIQGLKFLPPILPQNLGTRQLYVFDPMFWEQGKMHGTIVCVEGFDSAACKQIAFPCGRPAQFTNKKLGAPQKIQKRGLQPEPLKT